MNSEPRSDSFSLLLTPVTSDCVLPHRLADVVQVERPGPRDLEQIRPYFQGLNVPLGKFEKEPNEVAPGQFQYSNLPQSQWRYLICRWVRKPTPAQRTGLSTAFQLTDQAIQLGPFFEGSSIRGGIFDPIREAVSAWHLMTSHNDLGVSVTSHQLDAIGTYFSEITSLNENQLLPFDLFNGLQRIDRNSDMWLLGLFAVLESILTSKPEPTDPTSSIGRQIWNKIPLLENQFERLNYRTFGDSISPSKVWKLLYGIRSSIAHGNRPSYQQPMSPREAVFSFVLSATKLALTARLRNPTLVDDLRAC